MKNTKCIETKVRIQTLKEEILKEWCRKDWYAFMTCQPSDGCWNDDHNKYWFELKPANPPITQPQAATTPQAHAQDPNSK